MKVCIACSPGGHFAESLQVLPIVKKHEVFYYTIDVPYIRQTLAKSKNYLVSNPTRNPLKYFFIILSSLFVLLKEKPDVIITFGAGVTVPIALLGKLLFGSKLIYVECSAQVYKPAMSGKLIYPFADLFFVQWKYLKDQYGKKAIYGGLLI